MSRRRCRRGRITTGSRSSVWLVRGTPPCPRKRGRSGRPGCPSSRSFRVKAVAGMVRDEVVATVTGASRAVAAAGAAGRLEVAEARMEVAATEKAAAAPVVPAVVATAAVANLMAAVGDATGGATSRRSSPKRRATPLQSVLGARVLVTRRARAHRTRQCWQWSCRCQKRISPWKPKRSWRRK